MSHSGNFLDLNSGSLALEVEALPLDYYSEPGKVVIKKLQIYSPY